MTTGLPGSGSELMADFESVGLGSGAARVHNDVRLMVAKSDADLLSNTLNSTLVKWLVDYNFAGAGYPKLCRTFDKALDLNVRIDRDTNLVKLGFQPTVQYIHDTYGPHWRKRSEPVSSPAFEESSFFARRERAMQRALCEDVAAGAVTFAGSRGQRAITLGRPPKET